MKNFFSRIGISLNGLTWVLGFLIILLLSGCDFGSGGSGSKASSGSNASGGNTGNGSGGGTGSGGENAGPEGGMVTSGNKEVTLDIPAGALSAPTTISITANDSGGWELLPDGLTFTTPITATLQLPETPLLPDGSVRTGFPVLLVTSGAETEVPAQQVLNLDANTNKASLSAPLSHFSTVTQEIVPNVSVTVTDLPDGPELVGARFTLTVTLEATEEVEWIADRVVFKDDTRGNVVMSTDLDARSSDGKLLGDTFPGRAIKRTTKIEYECLRAGGVVLKGVIRGMMTTIFDDRPIEGYSMEFSKRILCIDLEAEDGSFSVEPEGLPSIDASISPAPPIGLRGQLGQSKVIQLTEEIMNIESILATSPDPVLIVIIFDLNPGVVSYDLEGWETPDGQQTFLPTDSSIVIGGGTLEPVLADGIYRQNLRHTCKTAGNTWIDYEIFLVNTYELPVRRGGTANLRYYFECVQGEVGSTILEEEPNNDRQNAQFLPPGTGSVEGSFVFGDTADYYGVNVANPTSLKISEGFTDNQVSVGLSLTGDDGNPIACEIAPGVFDAYVGQGDAFIGVITEEGEEGNYSFSISATPIDFETLANELLNLDDDPLNCGACGNICSLGENCVARQCVLPPSPECEGSSDGAVCGVNADRQCIAGQCIAVPPPPAECDGTNDGYVCGADGSQCIIGNCTAPPVGRNPILQLQKAGNFFGNILGNVQFGINCGQFCVYQNIPLGASLQLEAIPSAAGNSVFVNWEGTAVEFCGNNPVCNFDLEGDSVVTAVFNFPPSDDSKTLSVEVLGTGDGKVTMPGNINCGNMQTLTKCMATIFPLGGPVALTATASAGSVFTQWGGACEGQVGSICVFGTADPFAPGAGDPFAVTVTFTAVP